MNSEESGIILIILPLDQIVRKAETILPCAPKDTRVGHHPPIAPTLNEHNCKLHRRRRTVKESHHIGLDDRIFLSIPSVHRHYNLLRGVVEVLGLNVAVHLGNSWGRVIRELLEGTRLLPGFRF